MAKKGHAAPARPTAQGNIDFESADSLEELLQATDMEAVEGDRLAVLRYGNLWNRIRAGYKMNIAVDNSRISAQRNWFVSRQPYIDRLTARASRYLYYTVTEAERRGIPTELALLPVIESSYDPFATSNASAAGMWQFIPSTGRIYGLRQDQYYDGRRDIVESTRAAYDFLTSLYQQFGSWELALASYNAGGGRIQQAINRNVAAGLPTDYWSLRLPEETMNYVPRFMAVAQIMKNPESYGIQLNSIANRPHFRSVQLPGPVDLAQVVGTTGLSSKEVFELNPAFLQGVTSPTGPYRVLIPTSLSPVVDTRLKALQVVDPSRFGFSSDNGSYLAMNTPAITQSITRSDARTVNTTQAAAIMSSGSSRSSGNLGSSLSSTPAPLSSSSGGNLANVAPSTSISRNTQRIPTGADALAAMANQAKVPTQAAIKSAVANVGGVTTTTSAVTAPVLTASTVKAAPVIPQAVTTISPATVMTITTQPATTVNSNPNISVANTVAASNPSAPQPVTQSPIIVAPAQSPNVTPILAMSIDTKDTDQKNSTVPVLSSDDKSRVVDEIKSIAPANTAVVDPLDGKIPLTSIQTQQSVLDKQGETKSLSYEQPYLKTPTASDIKNRKLTPAETKVVADVKTVDKPKGTRTIYIVKAGDTLSSVATKTGLVWRDIAKWNQMDPNANLITGTPLYLYGAKKIAEAPTSYVVQPGDTLTDVAAQFSMTPRQLADLNRLKPTSNLIAGVRLTLVDDDSGKSAPTKDTSSKDVATKANAKSTDSIKETQVATDDYAIKRGDTLAKVAARYHMTTSSLAKLNGIPVTTSLQAGDTLSVPAADEPSPKTKGADRSGNDKAAVKKDSDKINTKDYTVHSGETLARIAAKNGMTVVALADLNNIPADTRIQTGDTLSIPDAGKASKRKSSRD